MSLLDRVKRARVQSSRVAGKSVNWARWESRPLPHSPPLSAPGTLTTIPNGPACAPLSPHKGSVGPQWLVRGSQPSAGLGSHSFGAIAEGGQEPITTARHGGNEARRAPVVLESSPQVPNLAVHDVALGDVVHAPQLSRISSRV